MRLRLKDKVALVTGAGQGIGLACADMLASEGAHVVLADVKEEAIRGEASRLVQGGAKAAWVVCDVTRRDHVQRAVAKAVSEFGRLDVLVSNAGVVHAADFLDLEEADFDRVLAVNLKGMF